MGFINKTLKRTRNGEIRLEEDRKGIIGDFFSNQDDTKSHQIVDEENWIVDIDGDVHVYAEDLVDGELPFKIGKLSGNLYTHVRNFKPGLIPFDMDGEIIFVEDEGTRGGQSQSSTDKDEDELGMGYLREKPRPYNKVLNSLEDALTECINNGYGIDIEAIKKKIQKEWEDRNKYKLVIQFEEVTGKYGGLTKHTGLYECKIFVDDSGKELKLTAIEIAVYLTYILYKEGINPGEIKPDFFVPLRQIYNQLAYSIQDRSDKSTGVMVSMFDFNTLNGYRSKIREAIKAHISNKGIVDMFAIEGYKDKPYKVQMATDEIRQQIKDTFGIE